MGTAFVYAELFLSAEESGWRKVLKASNGAGFLREILPKTHCHFYIFNYGKGLAIQNFHHDSPVGKEWYYVVPSTERMFSER